MTHSEQRRRRGQEAISNQNFGGLRFTTWSHEWAYGNGAPGGVQFLKAFKQAQSVSLQALVPKPRRQHPGIKSDDHSRASNFSVFHHSKVHFCGMGKQTAPIL
jgi:hypothetical protein